MQNSLVVLQGGLIALVDVIRLVVWRLREDGALEPYDL